MGFNDAIRQIMDEKGVRVADLARALDMRVPAVCNRLARENPSIAIAEQTARAVGYRLVLIPIDDDYMPPDAVPVVPYV